MTSIRVSFQDSREPGETYPVRKWAYEFVLNDAVEYRPLTLGAMLDMAEKIEPKEWAALQKAMANPGQWITV